MINWERDTLFFNTDIKSGKRLLSNAKHPDWFLKCRRLALNRVAFYGAALAGHHSSLFRELKNIEQLIVVIERKSVKFALAEAGDEVRKYERTGDHLAYALFQHPHIPRGLLVQEIGGKTSEVSLHVAMKINELGFS
jgi:tRNA pseudouridine-54 N-methylase